MQTDELLEKATARPWSADDRSFTSILVRNAERDPLAAVDAGGYIKSTAKANAALIVRAVNSFEAMRKVLRRAKLEIETDVNNAEIGVYKPLLRKIRAALKLADGEA